MYCVDTRKLYASEGPPRDIENLLGFVSDTSCWRFDYDETMLVIWEHNLMDSTETEVYRLDIRGLNVATILIDMLPQTFGGKNFGVTIVYRILSTEDFDYSAIVMIKYNGMIKTFDVENITAARPFLSSYVGDYLLLNFSSGIQVYDLRDNRLVYRRDPCDLHEIQAYLDPYLGRYLLVSHAEPSPRKMVWYQSIDLWTGESYNIDLRVIADMMPHFGMRVVSLDSRYLFNLASVRWMPENRRHVRGLRVKGLCRVRSMNPPWTMDVERGTGPEPCYLYRDTQVVAPLWYSCFSNLRENTRELHLMINGQIVKHKYIRRSYGYEYQKTVEGVKLVDRIDEWFRSV